MIIQRPFHVKFVWCWPWSLNEGRKRCVKTLLWSVLGKGLISWGHFHVFSCFFSWFFMFLWLHLYLENLGAVPKRKTYPICPFYSTRRELCIHPIQKIFFYYLIQLLPSPLCNLSEMEKSSIIGMDDSRGSSQPQQFCDSVSIKYFTIQQ